MPHLTFEYTSNLASLDIKLCLRELNQVLVDSGQFEEIDIKSRALRFDDFFIGTNPEQRAFIHLKLSLLNGRSIEVRRDLSARLLERLHQLCDDQAMLHVQLCVEVLEIESGAYAKTALVA